ncbi:MAG TPA: NAD-dependent epimerase/dehydratase family protein [Rhodocyclaceae bacterium]|nr:NAD-dependent epimerase/dehydratase family protein [Rhodocyclaceae bacterium]
MKVLVLGGTGVISRAVTAQLLVDGHDVTLFNRGKRTTPISSDVRQIIGDRNDRTVFREQMQKELFDVVIDMICFTPEDARSSIETFMGRVQQLIVCSSSLAYQRPYRAMPIREDMERLCEDPSSTFPRAYDKAEMERYLQQLMREGMPITIIRPSFTLGPGSGGFGVLRQNYGVIDRIRKGKPLVMFGDGNNPWSFTFTPDLALAFAGAVGNPATYGQHYHATSEECTVWKDAYLTLGKILGKDVEMFHMSSQILLHAAPQMNLHLFYEKSHAGLFDNSKIRRDIPGFRPRINLEQGLRDLLAWYEADANVIDPVKDALEDRLYAAHCDLLKQISNLYPN